MNSRIEEDKIQIRDQVDQFLLSLLCLLVKYNFPFENRWLNPSVLIPVSSLNILLTPSSIMSYRS